MENYNEVVFHYATRMKFFSNRRVLGLMFYKDIIDDNQVIQLCIVMDNYFSEMIHEMDYQDGFDLEYFQISLNTLNNLDYLNNDDLLNIVSKGMIFYDRTNQIRELQDSILDKVYTPLPKISDNLSKKLIVCIDKEIEKLHMMINNESLFNYNYFLLIENIKILYLKTHGLNDISMLEAFEIYSGKYTKNSFLFNLVPDDNFIKMYIDSIVCNGSTNDKMNMLEKFYHEVIKEINFVDKCKCFLKTRD